MLQSTGRDELGRFVLGERLLDKDRLLQQSCEERRR
jgi:hypothetical protein